MHFLARTIIENRCRLFVLILSVFFAGILCCLALLVIVYRLNSPDPNFPVNVDIQIEHGMTLRQVASLLEKKDVIRSSQYFYFIFFVGGLQENVKAGIYNFERAQSTNQIIHSLISGKNQSPTMRITFPEGFSSNNFYSYLPHLQGELSLDELREHEGYLFPDTYFISPTMNSEEIITLMEETLNTKVEQFRSDIEISTLSYEEIIILASIIEREANDDISRKMVSGILQNRLRQEMPLQVDAPFYYMTGKTSAELTETDLDSDSPYNTYTHSGLPPTPISNPGLASIDAVLHPTKTDFFYYLTDTEGEFHYALSFDEHKLNKMHFLR